MDITEVEDQEEISPIIQIFERLTFERGHELHDQVSSMIELFSLSDVSDFDLYKRNIQFCFDQQVTLEMLDTLIECVKVIFVHPNTNKNIRILDFLITLTHVTHINYTSNKNLSLVFDALIDIFSQVKFDEFNQKYDSISLLGYGSD